MCADLALWGALIGTLTGGWGQIKVGGKQECVERFSKILVGYLEIIYQSTNSPDIALVCGTEDIKC